MIDFHSHFLPGIDDGSDSISLSLTMLDAWCNQGIDTVCATPHFYAERNNPERFIRRREEAYNALREYMARYTPSNGGQWPDIRLGSEVHFFDGISRFEGLHELCLEGTNLLLLEMPFRTWTSRMIDEVSVIYSTTGLMPVAAHIERYLDQPRKLVKEFLDLDIFFQSNAEFFLESGTSRKAIKMLKKGVITFWGSDAHNMDRRPVNLGPALRVISKSLGEDFVGKLTNRQYDIIEQFSNDFF
ncbi:MAG: capsular polysaccharide biosynthesis protein [Clostridiales bacterium]|nr:capsular polysaccharide biosynthesis protein [Clostridiales bacterium]MBR3248019.1 capsular polysaccharide biosynthesis protein [Clostridiales bacterium]